MYQYKWRNELLNPYSEALQEIEYGLWEHDARVDDGVPPYTYNADTFRACVKIFTSALLWKLWEEQSRLNLDINKRCNEAVEVANELSVFIHNWTGIDTKEIYNER